MAERSGGDWIAACRLAFFNAAAFYVVSILYALFSEPQTVVVTAIAWAFFGTSMLCAARLMTTGEGLAPLAFYVLGSGLFFGFGTAYATTVATEDFVRWFPEWQHGRAIATLNVLNFASTAIVIAVASPLCAVRHLGSGRRSAGIGLVLALAYKYRSLLAGGAVLALCYHAVSAVDPALRIPSLNALTTLPSFTFILAGCALWKRITPGLKLMVVICIAVELSLAIPSLAKAAVVLPLLGAVSGFWLGGGTRRVAIVLAAISAVFYFAALNPLVASAREIMRARQISELTLADGLEALRLAAGEYRPGRDGPAPGQTTSARFSAAPFQWYLVKEYDAGRPGTSLQDPWIAVIPRALWPDKPIVTRFGYELYQDMNTGRRGDSALAPTYTAEAYWNGGWPAVVLVSILIGLEIGWLTRRWMLLVIGRSRKLGILVMITPAAFLAAWVEAWVVPTYVGGFAILALLILLADRFGATLLSGIVARRRPSVGRPQLHPGPSPGVPLAGSGA